MFQWKISRWKIWLGSISSGRFCACFYIRRPSSYAVGNNGIRQIVDAVSALAGAVSTVGSVDGIGTVAAVLWKYGAVTIDTQVILWTKSDSHYRMKYLHGQSEGIVPPTLHAVPKRPTRTLTSLSRYFRLSAWQYEFGIALWPSLRLRGGIPRTMKVGRHV